MEPSTSKHADTSQIKIKEEPIEDPFEMKEVLGLPMGRRKLGREGQREYNDPFLEEWKDQFKNINKLTIKALSDLIIDTKNTDYMFRMNILTLIAYTLESCENNSCLKFTVLRNVFEGDDVSDTDWCSYIIECASVSKVDWSKTKKKKDVVYYRPVMFLMDKGKEEVVDVEQESEMNERLEKQKQAETEKKIKNKGKEKVVDVEDESETNERVQKQSFNRVLKGRATVRPLFEAMRGLTPQRKRVVREMGFGNLIDFPIVEIPTKLAFYVVDILNTRKMMLECPMGDIVITPKTVKEVLGLPMGRRKLEREGQREYNDPFLEEWKDQFKNINKLTIKALSDLIIDTKNTDYMFRMNILTLIANTLGSCENSSCLKFTVLRNVFEGDDVSDIDWCSYIIECASVSKVDWSKTKKKKDVVYYGPVMFLMLTYLHYTKIDTFKVKRRVPAFKSWNTRLLKKREISELQNYYMGIAEILDDVGEKEENEEKEELYELLEESIESILIDKAEIEEKINENLIKFQNDERLIQLRDKMKVIFKEPNIPEYHSSSSTESDDDDDDNSQVGDDNEKSYGTQTDSVEEDHVQIVTETQQEEKNNLQYNDEENDEKSVYQSEDELMR
ncbi:hypothetical protein Tco_0983970, partial [Tanacetum coccineum]